MSRAHSGRPATEVTLDALRSGELGPDDVRIAAGTLQAQAQTAREHHNPQLAANLERAAELTALSDRELLAIYEALRPGRSTGAELARLANRLSHVPAPHTAALVREAREAYLARGLTA